MKEIFFKNKIVSLTQCMVALVRIVDSVRGKKLGRRTGRRSSLMKQTPQSKLAPGKWWGTNNQIVQKLPCIVFVGK